MSVIDFIEDVIDEAFDIVNEAKHDWYFARRQMNTIQSKSLYREDD